MTEHNADSLLKSVIVVVGITVSLAREELTCLLRVWILLVVVETFSPFNSVLVVVGITSMELTCLEAMYLL